LGLKPLRKRGHIKFFFCGLGYRKVTRKIYDFSPEQLKGLTSIVWLHRGESNRFVGLIAEHLNECVVAGLQSVAPTSVFITQLIEAIGKIAPFFKSQSSDERAVNAFNELGTVATHLGYDAEAHSPS
jgi:hypothetical protein